METAVDIALAPGRWLPAGWSWLWAAGLTGVVAGGLWRGLQSPARLRRAADAAWAGLLAVWLFRHEPHAAARAQARALAANVRLLVWLLLPALGSAVLSAPLWSQLPARYGYRPLQPGDAALLRVDCVDADALARLHVDWAGGAGVVEALVREPATATAVARLRAGAPGAAQVTIRAGGTAVALPVAIGGPAAAGVLGGSPWRRWLRPGSAPLPPGTGLRSVAVDYEPLPWRHWVGFAFVSCAGGLLAALPRRRV